MTTNNKIPVKNRSGGLVIYKIPELNVRREFSPSETKSISFEELEALTYQPGGKELINSYLLIADAEVVRDLGLKTEPEYWMTEAEVKKLMTEGSYEAFLDCLDFAPQGILDLVLTLAVGLPLNDSRKREAIKEKLNFDVDKALMHIREEKEDDEPVQVQQRRRVQTEVVAEAPMSARRTEVNVDIEAVSNALQSEATEDETPALPKYKVVTPKTE